MTKNARRETLKNRKPLYPQLEKKHFFEKLGFF